MSLSRLSQDVMGQQRGYYDASFTSAASKSALVTSTATEVAGVSGILTATTVEHVTAGASC